MPPVELTLVRLKRDFFLWNILAVGQQSREIIEGRLMEASETVTDTTHAVQRQFE